MKKFPGRIYNLTDRLEYDHLDWSLADMSDYELHEHIEQSSPSSEKPMSWQTNT